MSGIAARYDCCDRLRRAAVAAHPTLNGIDWLDVLDLDAPVGMLRQQTLIVHLLKPVDAALVALLGGGEGLVIEGGRRQPATALWAAPALSLPPGLPAAERLFLEALPDADHVIVVRTDSNGDYSRFRLALRRSLTDPRPPIGFDMRLSEFDFSFKVECPQPFDCHSNIDCANPPAPEPELDYLARDYDGYRRLVLGRLRTLLPGWTATTAADLGVTLAEILAYVGDQLSWRLDAQGSEAYLATARHRASLRRHALLVDYRVSEGSNARTLVQLQLAAGTPGSIIALAGMAFLTAPVAKAGVVSPDPASPAHAALRDCGALLFEPCDPEGRIGVGTALLPPAGIRIDPAHHEMQLYAWGDARCCLATGRRAATLAGHFPGLALGDLLLFEQMRGPESGAVEDADARQRHAVRLQTVRAFDGVAPLVDALTGAEITEIGWSAEDALPFPVCVSARIAGVLVTDITVVRGNLLMADHGETVRETLVPDVPADWLVIPRASGSHCAPLEPASFRPVRFRPQLARAPLTHGATEIGADPAADRGFAADSPVAALWQQGSSGPAQPRIALFTDGERWDSRPDLLLSGPADAHFVAEMATDGHATLRFGDGRFGRRPRAGARFEAVYRVGSGPAGNVGPDTLRVVATADLRIAGCRNPLSARSGAAPETAAQIRRRVPYAFLRKERAVTLEDWAEKAGELAGVERATAISRWTGSWRTTTILLDLKGGAPVTDAARAEALLRLQRFRIATRDLMIGSPLPVPLLLGLRVCVAPGAVRVNVEAGLRRVLGSGRDTAGRPAFFHPDRLSFGQTLHLSAIYATALKVPGITSVEALQFARQDAPDDPLPMLGGKLGVGATEIPRLDSNPDFPDWGRLELELRGGR